MVLYAMIVVRGIAVYKATPPLLSGNCRQFSGEPMIDKSPMTVKQKRRWLQVDYRMAEIGVMYLACISSGGGNVCLKTYFGPNEWLKLNSRTGLPDPAPLWPDRILSHHAPASFFGSHV